MALTLSEIYIYPIKSLGGVRIKKANVLAKGLEYDRRFMLIDESGRFISQRQYQQMALLKPSIEGGKLIVTGKGLSPIEIPLSVNPNAPSITVSIWKDTCRALLMGKEYDEWFSDALQLKCRLVGMPEGTKRFIKKEWSVHNETVSFADGYPYLIVGQTSLDDLNKKLSTAIPMNRFRPNLVFTGGTAYEEDNWSSYLTIGNVSFRGLKPCIRCVLTTVDQITGKKGKEPLQTLSKYRTTEKGVIFGQHLVAAEQGTLKEGDAIKITGSINSDNLGGV